MRKELSQSILITLVFLTCGMVLLEFELIGFGFSFFTFLPFIIGYVLGQGRLRKFSLYGFAFTLIIFLILLILGGLEGMVCVLMALILIFAMFLAGYILMRVMSYFFPKEVDENLIKSTALPLILFVFSGLIENHFYAHDKEIISVKTEMTLPYTAVEVYESIKSVDTLIATKSFLMKLDLPIPNKCILEKEEVGGLRTCYFSQGTITEKITELEKGKVLKMDVIDYQLTGRKWLGFKEAIYYFDNIGQDSSKITRITTYTSELKPRFYWEPLERMGITQEHDYVFENLRNDLMKKYGH